MEYGLITIHSTQNFGSLLQTFSTISAIRSLGISITLIDYHNEKIDERETAIFSGNKKSLKDVIKKILWGKDQKRKYYSINNFLKENTVMTNKSYTVDTIQEVNSKFDGFITGSDIVWGTKITGEDMSYFLDFADSSKKKLAFSSSIGSKWNQEEMEKIKPLLERYDSISVREELASEWIKEVIGKKTEVTCDPTMLWDASYWRKFVEPEYETKKKYVLIYAVNPDKRNIYDGIKYAKEHKMKAYFVNFYGPIKGTKTIRPITVQQWITLFANAEIVFSASYHGLLFSLYFQKNVFFYNRGEKSRMISLAKELNIEHREGTEENLRNNKLIDYKFVDKKMREKRNESWTYLKNIFKEE